MNSELLPKGSGDPTRVYMELWFRDFDLGFVELEDEDEHAFSAGFVRGRAVRSWLERMRLLERLGFIRIKPRGNRDFGYVLLLHP